MEPTLDAQIFIALRKLIASVILFNDRVAQQTGMSMSESQFVHLLELHGSLTPSQLAAHSGLTSGSVTGVIDRLETLGFVERERHPKDRRKVVVVLNSAKVAQQLAPHYAEQSKHVEQVVAQLTEMERAATARFLTMLTDEPSSPA